MKRQMYTQTGIILIGAIVIFLSSQWTFAAETPILYLFWGDGCPHCEKEKHFLQNLRRQYPELEMRWFETWEHPEFAKLADSLRKAYKIKTASVPMTFLGAWSRVGFRSADTTGTQIVKQIENCLQAECQDALAKLGPQAIVEKIYTEAVQNKPKNWEYFPALSKKKE